MSLPSDARAQRVRQWIRPAVQALKVYHVPDASGLVKLDAMENPYTWPVELVEEWTRCLSQVSLNRYPDPAGAALKSRLRQAMGIPGDADLLLGNGSDELIQMMLMALSGADRKVLAPEPTFSMYRMISTFVGLDFVGVPLRSEDFELDLGSMLDVIDAVKPAVVFLSYPNNPTGNLFERAAIHAIVQAAPGLVVVDEAYHAFADRTFIHQTHRYDNLVVLRTLSKMGLAGLRLGLLAGPKQWLDEFDKVRLPYNINTLTQVSADFALRHHKVFDAQTRDIAAARDRMVEELGGIPGVTAYPSQANFVLFRVPAGRAAHVFEGLKQRGVLIKSMHGSSPMLDDCLRVTVGTADENQAFMDALAQVMAE